MQRADRETSDRPPAEGRARAAMSVAILAAVACVPIVVAAGFIADRLAAAPSAVPGDISVLALRGVIDGEPAHRPAAPARAGY